MAYNHQCEQCGAFYIPYETNIPCPKCGIIEDERFDFLIHATKSLRFNKMMGGSYIPTGWWSGSLGDHILWRIFPLFDAYEKVNPNNFEAFATEWFSASDWRDQQYLCGHVLGIALRLHDLLQHKPVKHQVKLHSIIDRINSLVKYEIIEPTGFSNHELPASQALAEIKRYIQTKSGWLYINGESANPDGLTVDDLVNASTIVIAAIILGG